MSSTNAEIFLPVAVVQPGTSSTRSSTAQSGSPTEAACANRRPIVVAPMPRRGTLMMRDRLTRVGGV